MTSINALLATTTLFIQTLLLLVMSAILPIASLALLIVSVRPAINHHYSPVALESALFVMLSTVLAVMLLTFASHASSTI